MNESYYITFYKRIIVQQTDIAEKAINSGNTSKAKVAFNQVINAYKELLRIDPQNKDEYNAAISDTQAKIDNVEKLKPAPAAANNNTSSNNANKANNDMKKSSGPSSAVQGKDEKKQSESKNEPRKIDESELKEALDKLNSLIGLAEVKKQINEWVKQVRIFQERRARGIPASPLSYHMVFTGNPGTGKTTVARLVAQIYHALGISATDSVKETDRDGLVASYYGQTVLKTNEVIDKAMGGILFIDEAYTLKQDDRDTFGQEAIDALLKAMEDKRDQLVVIAAGYENDMKRFISANPGLESRFKNFINFTDYNGDDLFKIAMTQIDKYEYIIDDNCKEMLKKHFDNLYKNKNENFGNARTVRNFFENLVTCQSSRLKSEYDDLSQVDGTILQTITEKDIENAIFAK